MAQPTISICLCCHNDAPYLKLLLRSIIENTTVPFEICVVDNGSTDGTQAWLLEQREKLDGKLKVAGNIQNIGVGAVNQAVELSSGKYVLDINSDMIVLPGWDMALLRKLKKLERMNDGFASVSATLIEPRAGNPEYHFGDFGSTPDTCKYQSLTQNASRYLQDGVRKKDTIQFSHPILMSRETWDKVGGISDGYPFPGMCTDVDLGFKLLKNGAKCVMCGDAVVYHFGSATLIRMRGEGVETPPGEKEFAEKFGAFPRHMYDEYDVRKEFQW